MMAIAKATVTAMKTATMWALVIGMRLVGNEEGRRKGGKGNFYGDEGYGHLRGQGRQGNGTGNKDCGQVDSNGNNAGDGDND